MTCLFTKQMEEKRKEFAKAAAEFIEHLASRKKEIDALTGEPEVQYFF